MEDVHLCIGDDPMFYVPTNKTIRMGYEVESSFMAILLRD